MFSPAAADGLDAFAYQQTTARLDKAGVLYAGPGDYADLELDPDVVSHEAKGVILDLNNETRRSSMYAAARAPTLRSRAI